MCKHGDNKLVKQRWFYMRVWLLKPLLFYLNIICLIFRTYCILYFISIVVCLTIYRYIKYYMSLTELPLKYINRYKNASSSIISGAQKERNLRKPNIEDLFLADQINCVWRLNRMDGLCSYNRPGSVSNSFWNI